MSRRIFSTAVSTLSIIYLLTGCGHKPSSFGDFQKIVVYADSSLYRQIQPELEQVFDQFIYTPHMERSFILDLQPLTELGTYQTRRNIVFLGLLNNGEMVSRFLTDILSEQTKQAVTDGKVFEIFREDLFATDQVVMLFPATNIENLKQNLRDRGQVIFNRFNEIYTGLLKKSMYETGEQTALAEYLKEKYGWQLRVPHDFQLVKEEEQNNFVWLRRLNPDRSLLIYRLPAETFEMTEERLYDLRDSLTTAVFEGDSIDKSDTYIQTVEFSGQMAQKMIGVWQNHTHLIGGAFRTYVLFDKINKFLYLIDLTVTAPGKRKKPLIDQLEVIANTFFLPNR